MRSFPFCPNAHSADALLSGLSTLPQGDFLRLAVTAGFIAPEAPLASDDLLALRESPTAARTYVDHYLRLTGRARAHLLWILDEPEAARDELVGIIRLYLAGPFAEVEPTIHDERERATRRLASCSPVTGPQSLPGCASYAIWTDSRPWSSRRPSLFPVRAPTITRSVNRSLMARRTNPTCL